MRPRPRLFPAEAGVPATALLTSKLLGSTGVWGAEVAAAFLSLRVTQLTEAFPAVATVTAVDLTSAGRTLVNVGDCAVCVAYRWSGTSWAQVADFAPPALSASGNALVQKNVTAGNRAGGWWSRAFVTVDCLGERSGGGPILPSARSSTTSTALGIVVGQWANGDYWQGFSREPLDTDQGGSGQVIGRGWSHATTDEVATTTFVGSAALRRCRARAFRGAQRECEHISGA